MSSSGERISELRRAQDPERSTEPSLAGAAPAAITLVPNSCIQFLDLGFSDMDAIRIRRRFFEEQEPGSDEGPTLHAVTIDSDAIQHPVTGDALSPSDTYAVDMAQAFEPFLDHWVPIPFLRSTTGADGEPMLDDGPTNWARIYVTSVSGHDDRRVAGYRIVLALDTAIDTKPTARSRAYAAPRLDDVLKGASFIFSDDESDIAGFVSEAWVDDWIADLYREHRQRQALKDGQDESDADYGLEHLAHYLTFLSVLKAGCDLPPIRFLRVSPETASASAAGVDLVLDLGTSRTAAVLKERRPAGEPMENARVTLLPLRELSEPWRVHAEIFSSRIAFSKTALGNEAWSRWSGRTNAFFWPSLVRTGREAERLSANQPASEDRTGLSSPMHYLWDGEPAPQAWRFARPGVRAAARGALLSGLQLAPFTETGDVVDYTVRGSAPSKPRFSRSSLVTFLAAELIVQAVVAMNAPRYRKDGKARALERVVLTTPAGLSPHEHAILKNRVTGAVEAVWQSMGWLQPEMPLAPRKPEVVLASDNATNAGLAYLQNELGFKFRGKAREYIDLMGKQRPEHKNGRSLRIASLDIGGASTGLSIATYELSETGTLIQTPEIVDGCRIGATDILKAIVERHLIPVLERRLIDCKLPSARKFLARVIAGQSSKRTSLTDDFGRRFATEVAHPLAIGVLETFMASRTLANDVPVERTLESLASVKAHDARAVLDELEELAADEGADAFLPHEILVSFRDRDIAATIRSVLDPVLANTARIVRAFDCDVILVSGWAARLAPVLDTLVERMPAQLNRIVSLPDYRVANWYALRQRSGTIGDSKSAAAMGAVVASSGVAAGGLPIAIKPLETDATRLYLGRMNERSLVDNDTVMFVLCESAAANDGNGKYPRVATATFDPPMLIGGRRIALENWPATPLFGLDYEPEDPKARIRSPLKVTIERVPGDNGLPETLKVVRACDADGTNLAPSDVALRLQTLRSAKGHWLDTGAIDID